MLCAVGGCHILPLGLQPCNRRWGWQVLSGGRIPQSPCDHTRASRAQDQPQCPLGPFWRLPRD